MLLRYKPEDTFIKDGMEYIVLATSEVPMGYVFKEGITYIVSQSFHVEELEMRKADVEIDYP